MLYTTVLATVAAFAGLASAQNTSVIPCCSVDASKVPDTQRTAWCQAERNTCPEICGGLGQIASKGNDCDDKTLNFTCTCKNGTKPNMALYEQSVPGQMCRFWYDACINATFTNSVPNLAQQFQCEQDRNANCGNLTSDGSVATTSGASATRTAASTGGNNAASATASSSIVSSAGATALAMAREYGTPLIAGGMAALFGLAL